MILLEPRDRIWVIEHEWDRGEYIETSEIIIRDEENLPPSEEGWRVSEYVRVKEDS